MSQGTIKFFNAAKGFGFVTPDGGAADVFLPGAAVAAAGIAAIRPGQRVAFEQAPDTKGPKIVSLKLVGEAPPKSPAPATARVTVYCDTGADAAADIAEAVRASGFALTMQDIMTAPPSADELKRLSPMLSASGQSLVRRYDPLFFALQLDDRFITDQDFWTAIVEHPTLINRPVLVSSGRAKICKTGGEARAFLRNDEATPLPKAKTLSPRMMAILNGEDPPPAEPAASMELPAPKRPTVKAAAPKTEVQAKPAAQPRKPAAKPPAKKAAPAKAVAKKPAPKKAAPKIAARPAKKAKARARTK